MNRYRYADLYGICGRCTCVCIYIQTQSDIYIYNSFMYVYMRLVNAYIGVNTATCIALVLYMCGYVYTFRHSLIYIYTTRLSMYIYDS